MSNYWVEIGIGITADTPKEAAELAWAEVNQHYMDVTDEVSGEFEQIAVSDVIGE